MSANTSTLSRSDKDGQSRSKGASPLSRTEMPPTGQHPSPVIPGPTGPLSTPPLPSSPDLPKTASIPHDDPPAPVLLPIPLRDRPLPPSPHSKAHGSDDDDDSYLPSTSQAKHMDRGSQETITRPYISATTHETHPQARDISPPSSPSTHSITLAPASQQSILEDAGGNRDTQPHVRILRDTASAHSSAQRGRLQTRSHSPLLRQEVVNTVSGPDAAEVDAKRRRPRSVGSGGMLRNYHQPLPPLPATPSAAPAPPAPPSPHLSNQVDLFITRSLAEGQLLFSQQHSRRSQSSIHAGLGIDHRSSGSAGAAGSRSNVVGTMKSTPIADNSHHSGPGIIESPHDELHPIIVSPPVTGHQAFPSHYRSRTLNSIHPRSDVDWIIPLDDKVQSPFHSCDNLVPLTDH